MDNITMRVSVILHWLIGALFLGAVLYMYMYLNLGKTTGKGKVSVMTKSTNYTGLKPEIPDNRSLAEKRQSERMALITEYCRKHDRRNITFPTLRRFVVNERHKLLYCQVFKTGSTTTLTILHNLEHRKKKNTFSMRKSLDRLPFKRLKFNYTKEEVRLRFEKYTKLLIVRDPLERLVSAWKDKFVEAPSRFWYRKHYQSMMETLNPDTDTGTQQVPTENPENMTSQLVPFLAFIKAVGTNRTDWQDLHWELISNLCTPCQIHYDFIAHTETLSDDFPLFFKKANIFGRDDLLPKTRERAGKRLFLDVYRQIPLDDLHRIKLKFTADYDMFGYSFDEDITDMLDR